MNKNTTTTTVNNISKKERKSGPFQESRKTTICIQKNSFEPDLTHLHTFFRICELFSVKKNVNKIENFSWKHTRRGVLFTITIAWCCVIYASFRLKHLNIDVTRYSVCKRRWPPVTADSTSTSASSFVWTKMKFLLLEGCVLFPSWNQSQLMSQHVIFTIEYFSWCLHDRTSWIFSALCHKKALLNSKKIENPLYMSPKSASSSYLLCVSNRGT